MTAINKFGQILALLAVAIMGIVQLARGRQSESLQGDIFAGSSISPGRYALALYSGLWAYDGWDQACYVAGEMKNVSRDLPLTIHTSLPLMILLFVTANICKTQGQGSFVNIADLLSDI